MDEELQRIINQIFSVRDVEIIKKLLDVINNDLSEVSKGKRINAIDNILNGADIND